MDNARKTSPGTITNTETIFKKWKNVSDKHVRTMEHLNFLEDCTHFNIIPKFLNIGNKTIRKLFPNEVNQFERNLLKRTINQKKRYSFSLITRAKEHKQELKRLCNENDFCVFENKITHYRHIRERIMRRNHNNKLRHWLKRRGETSCHQPIQHDYLNLTGRVFDAHTDSILKLGPKYILNEPINKKDVIASIESAITFLPNEIADQIRDYTHKHLMKLQRNPATKKDYFRDISDRNCLQKIKKDPNITSIKTDKTGKICILPKVKYHEMMEEAMKKMDIEEVNNNPLNKLTEKTKDLIKNGKWIDDKPPRIDNHAPRIPRMFGTYKDHKDPPTIRPIVNRTEGPTKPIEQYMKHIYQSIMPPSEYSINSNEQFLKKLRETEINENDSLVSFDVKDLYPSINIKEITPIINEKIADKYKDQDLVTTLTRANNLLLNESFFSFNHKIYKQMKGVPMGSCISGYIAEIKMRILENKMKELKLPIKLWTRYVDDVFCVVKENTNPENILKTLNEIDDNIKFTLEKETNGKINYLDVQIIRNNKSLETTVFRKPNKSEEIIHSKCSTPYNYKIAAIRSYINRAITICSNQNLLKEELKNIEKIASRAGYNKNLIKTLYKNRIKALNHIQNAQARRKKFTNPIPYIKGISTGIQQLSRRSDHIIPIKPNPSIFQRIRNGKDKTDPLEQPGIYEIKFKTNKEEKEHVYVGMTKRKIITRYKEHLRDIKQQKNTTALAQFNLKNPIDPESIQIRQIAPYKNHYYAVNRESVEIIDKSAINKNESTILHAKWREMVSSNRRTTRQPSGERAEKDISVSQELLSCEHDVEIDTENV